MEGRTHRLFQPVFTTAVIFQMSNMGIPMPLPAAVMALGCSYFGNLTANAPDGDKYLDKNNRQYRVFKKKRHYFDNRNWMKGFSYLFEIMGAKSHRCWQSHALLLWLLVWGSISAYTYFNWYATRSIIFGLLFMLIFGLSLGYWSHLAGDWLTKDSIPLAPFSNKRVINLTGKVGFARASSKFYNMLLLILAIEVCMVVVVGFEKTALFNVKFMDGSIRIITTVIGEVMEAFKK